MHFTYLLLRLSKDLEGTFFVTGKLSDILFMFYISAAHTCAYRCVCALAHGQGTGRRIWGNFYQAYFFLLNPDHAPPQEGGFSRHAGDRPNSPRLPLGLPVPRHHHPSSWAAFWHQGINPSPSSLSLSLQGCPALGKPDIQTEVWSASETINLAGEGYQAGGLGSSGLGNIWASWPSTPPPTRTSHLCQSLREQADFLSFFFLKMNRAGCGRPAGPICPLPRLNLIPIHPPLFDSLF